MDNRENTGSTLEKRRPLILEIKGNSLDDGPGIRTVVFFKGCPLSCVWCHNPESKRSGPEVSFDAEACVDCGACLEACGEGALDRSHSAFVDRARCTLCHDCVEVCPSGALARVGRFMETGEVATEVIKDLPFFRNSGGGVTLSGGEPTLHMDYASSLLETLKAVGVHTLVETCGLFDMGEFERKLLPFLDCVYFDLKIMEASAHREHCGASNEVILDNLSDLFGRSLAGGVEVLPRLPLVPGVTDTEENLQAVASFLRDLGAGRIALLEYNPLWVEKGLKIGQGRPEGGRWSSWMDRNEVRRCKSSFSDFELI